MPAAASSAITTRCHLPSVLQQGAIDAASACAARLCVKEHAQRLTAALALADSPKEAASIRLALTRAALGSRPGA